MPFIDKRKNSAERKKLERGPAIAILNSAFGCGGSPFICAMPPKMKSVMLSMEILYFLATKEWANSWNTTEAKRRKAARAPLVQ